MMARKFIFCSLFLSGLFVACSDKGGGGDGDACPLGSVNCECFEDNTCSGSLVCQQGTCFALGSTGVGDGDGDGSGGRSGNASGGRSGSSSGGMNGNGTGGMSDGGMGGMGGGETVSCDETGDFPAFTVAPRSDTSADWDDNDFDDVTITEDECGFATVAAEWPHESGWENDDPGEANMEATKFTLEFPYTADLTGKRLNLELIMTDDGRGTSATNGGVDVYLGAQDSDYTEISTPYDSGNVNMPGYSGETYNSGDTISLSLDMPSAVQGDFDPADPIKLIVRINNKFWGDGSDPVFDYETTMFELVYLTVTDP